MAPQRREFLGWALGGAVAAAGARAGLDPACGGAARQAGSLRRRHGAEGGHDARGLALQAARRAAAVAVLRAHLRAIRRHPPRTPGTAIWANDKLGFSLEPLHRGFVYTTPIAINIVENGMSQRLIYDPADYDFGKLQPPTRLGDLGFSGLQNPRRLGPGLPGRGDLPGRELLPLARPRPEFRRDRARRWRSGPATTPARSSRLFREFWVEKPAPASNTLTIHALLDSQSVTGAFRFTIRPLETTIIDTEMTLIGRVGDRQARHRGDGGGLSVQRPRPPADRRLARGGLRGRPAFRCCREAASGSGGRCRTARPCRSPPSPTSIRAASVSCSAPGRSTTSTTTRAAGNSGRRCGSNRSETGAKATCACSRFPVTTENNANILAQWRPKAGVAGRGRRCRSPIDSSGAGRRRRSRSWRSAPRAAPESSAASRASPSRWRATSSPIRRRPRRPSPTCTPIRERSFRSSSSPTRTGDRCASCSTSIPGSDAFSELRLTLNVDNQAVSETWLYRWTA